MSHVGRAPGSVTHTSGRRGRIPAKVVGALVLPAVLIGGAVSASALTIEGAGVLGNALMLSLFSKSKTPPVTIVSPSSPAPVLANDIPADTGSGVPPAPVQIAETPTVTEPTADLSPPPTPAPTDPIPSAVVVALTNLTQPQAGVSPSSPDPMGTASPLDGPSSSLAATMEAPEPTAVVLLATGLMGLAAVRARQRRKQPKA